MKEIFKLHADICKTFANATRLEVIDLLGKREMSTVQLLKILGIKKATLFQHLGVLVQKGVVRPRREGINIFYSLTDEKITSACNLMREVLIKKLENGNKILKTIKKGR